MASIVKCMYPQKWPKGGVLNYPLGAILKTTFFCGWFKSRARDTLSVQRLFDFKSRVESPYKGLRVEQATRKSDILCTYSLVGFGPALLL